MSTPADQHLPAITAVPTLPPTDQTRVLDLLFEPSPAIHDLLLPVIKQPFHSYDDLIDEARRAFLSLQAPGSAGTDARLRAIVGSHPRLGAGKIASAQSAAEQAQLAAAAVELAMLNERYEEAFPGLRYVVFVNGREKDVIMRDMRRRIERRDAGLEVKEAIEVGFSPVHSRMACSD
jgi:2-oxo-4-hydroxy-4-carboxy--5-ureidoimidazoline (OHCU) decarboxylase